MQTLVGQAGEALGITEDPLTSVAGVRVSHIIIMGPGVTLSLWADSGGHQGRPGHGGLGPQHGDLRHHQPHRGRARRRCQGHQEKARSHNVHIVIQF